MGPQTCAFDTGVVKNEGFDVNRIAFRAHGADAISGSVPVWGEGGVLIREMIS